MPRRPLENLTESMFYVLLALRRGPMCGMEIAAFLERATNGRLRIGPATLYTVLSKFEEVKYIEEIAVEGRKRTYRITQRGVEAYNAEINRLTACLMDAETIGGLLHDLALEKRSLAARSLPGLRCGGNGSMAGAAGAEGSVSVCGKRLLSRLCLL